MDEQLSEEEQLMLMHQHKCALATAAAASFLWQAMVNSSHKIFGSLVQEHPKCFATKS